jgi:phosphoribosylaminoimidazolecarboxamide formyltransferase/IMP cyclohydrolase
VAPSYTREARRVLDEKKNLRVLDGDARDGGNGLDLKRVRGGVLVQERASARLDDTGWQVVTKRSPDAEEHTDLLFAWRAVASVKSNAIVLARHGATIGIGAGQMSRVDAAFLAVHKARGAGHETAGAALGSDAFFPFRDGVDQAAEAGVRAIVQPGGSVRDAEVIAAADQHGMAMVFTGRRTFRH